MPEPKSPYKRVRRGFSQQTLKRICEMHESEFAGWFDMEVWKVQQRSPHDYYLYQNNNSNILAVAHLDTVMDHERRTASFVSTQAGPVVYSGALDDRLGAYTILELLPKLGIQYDILLTVGEESGASTAQYFTPPDGKEYNWMIEFDRGGTDVVLYQYEDKETVKLVSACGAKVGNGIFSDISYLDHLEVKGFNWGVGYRDYHGPRSHAYLEDYWTMIGHYLKFHEANLDIYLPHENNGMGMGMYGGRRSWAGSTWQRPSDGWWNDDLDDDLVLRGGTAAGSEPWEDDSNWGEAEWDAYIDGGIQAVRDLCSNGKSTALVVLDDDGDLVSEDPEVVQRAMRALG